MFREVIKKIAKLSFWTTISQLITVISIPFLAKIYTPEEFGEYGFYSAIVAFISAIIGLRFDYAISAADKGDEDELLVLSFLIAMLVTFILILPLRIFDINDAFLLALTSMSVLMFNSCQAYLIKIGRINKASALFCLRTFTMVSFQFALFDSVNGLVLGYSFSFFLTVIVFLALNKVELDIYKLKSVFLKYFDFCKFNLPHTLLNVTGNNMPYYFLDIFFGKDTVGFFTMAMRIVQVPHRFISNAIRQVVTGQYKSLDGKGIYIIFTRVNKLIFLSSFCVFFILFFTSDFLVDVFLGNDWSKTGVYISILCFWFGLSLCNVPSLSLLTACGQLKSLFILESVSFFLRVVVFLLPYFMLVNDFTVIGMYGFVGVIFNLLIIGYAYNYAQGIK